MLDFWENTVQRPYSRFGNAENGTPNVNILIGSGSPSGSILSPPIVDSTTEMVFAAANNNNNVPANAVLAQAPDP